MPSRIVSPQEAVCRAQWWAILRALKCSLGKPVKSLVDDLNLSYMGIRQHLDSMEKQKLVEGVRRARKVGRPEKVYRLTERGQEVFVQREQPMLRVFFEAAAHLFDAHAPEKMLLYYFQRQGDGYARQMDVNSVLERATILARLRSQDGYFSRCEFDNEHGLRLEEFHHPLAELQSRYPTLVLHEQAMMERVLGTAIQRREQVAGTHRRVSWEVPTLA